MNKRYLLAFLFSLLILLAYPHYLRLISPTQLPPTGYKEAPEEKLLVRMTPRVEGRATIVPLKKGLYDLVFSTRGGTLLSLKKGDTFFYESGPEGEGIFGVRLTNEREDLTREIFQSAPIEEKELTPTFVFETPGEYRLTKKFFSGSENPTIVLELELENLSGREKHFPLEVDYSLETPAHDPQGEASTEMVGYSAAGELRGVALGKIKKAPFESPEALEWHGLLRKYDALLVKPDLKIIGQMTEAGEGTIRSRLKLAPVSLAAGEKKTLYVLIYAGPQHYETLKHFGFGFERILTKGALGYPRLWTLVGLNFFYGLTKNYGAAILLLTLLIKLLFTPLTHMSYQSMGKMQALQPKVKAIQNQYKKDPQRMNKETMDLYRRNRVNPMSGCFPMLLQIPIFIAFYQVLSATPDLQGAPFVWWIKDLSAPDRLFTWPFDLPFVGNSFNLLPILMIGSMLWQQKLTPQTAATPGQEKIMYLMPIIFGFVFYNLPSGLVLYWFVNNLLTIFHQLFVKRIPIILHHEDR